MMYFSSLHRFATLLICLLKLHACSCHGEDDGFGDLGLDLTGKDAQCLEDTGFLLLNSDDLVDASLEYSLSMDLPDEADLLDESLASMTIVYPQEAVDMFRAVCEQEGGTLLVIQEGNYDCVSNDISRQLTIQNVANCVASTDSCKDIDQEHFLVALWQELGMECDAESAPTEPLALAQSKPPAELAVKNESEPEEVEPKKVQNIVTSVTVFMLLALGVFGLRRRSERLDKLELTELQLEEHDADSSCKTIV
jgi:hypothetical protein